MIRRSSSGWQRPQKGFQRSSFATLSDLVNRGATGNGYVDDADSLDSLDSFSSKSMESLESLPPFSPLNGTSTKTPFKSPTAVLRRRLSSPLGITSTKKIYSPSGELRRSSSATFQNTEYGDEDDLHSRGDHDIMNNQSPEALSVSTPAIKHLSRQQTQVESPLTPFTPVTATFDKTSQEIMHFGRNCSTPRMATNVISETPPRTTNNAISGTLPTLTTSKSAEEHHKYDPLPSRRQKLFNEQVPTFISLPPPFSGKEALPRIIIPWLNQCQGDGVFQPYPDPEYHEKDVTSTMSTKAPEHCDVVPELAPGAKTGTVSRCHMSNAVSQNPKAALNPSRVAKSALGFQSFAPPDYRSKSNKVVILSIALCIGVQALWFRGPFHSRIIGLLSGGTDDYIGVNFFIGLCSFTNPLRNVAHLQLLDEDIPDVKSALAIISPSIPASTIFAEDNLEAENPKYEIAAGPILLSDIDSAAIRGAPSTLEDNENAYFECTSHIITPGIPTPSIFAAGTLDAIHGTPLTSKDDVDVCFEYASHSDTTLPSAVPSGTDTKLLQHVSPIASEYSSNEMLGVLADTIEADFAVHTAADETWEASCTKPPSDAEMEDVSSLPKEEKCDLLYISEPSESTPGVLSHQEDYQHLLSNQRNMKQPSASVRHKVKRYFSRSSKLSAGIGERVAKSLLGFRDDYLILVETNELLL